MTNTMADLRREVAKRLRNTLHGKEIDTMEKGQPEIEHMLGIVTLGAISTEKCEKGTLLDPNHEFWQSYYENVNTKKGVKREIRSAMQSLKDDNVFRVASLYGEDAGILYVEVGDIDESPNQMTVMCAECGASIQIAPELTMHYGRYRLIFRLNCEACDFSETVGNDLYNQ